MVGAQLDGAYLRETQMEMADLSFARFRGANLKDVKMDRALLSGAQLCGAAIMRSQIRSASWDNSHLQGALFQNVDLSLGKGLTQKQLNGVVGLGKNQLPATTERLPPLEVASCWDQKPECWDSLMTAIFGKPGQEELQRAERILICSGTNPKRFQTGPLP